jgi:hypothetical protein
MDVVKDTMKEANYGNFDVNAHVVVHMCFPPMHGAPSTHSMSGLSLARHVYGAMGHVHWSSHCGAMLSCGLEFWLPAFMSV